MSCHAYILFTILDLYPGKKAKLSELAVGLPPDIAPIENKYQSMSYCKLFFFLPPVLSKIEIDKWTSLATSKGAPSPENRIYMKICLVIIAGRVLIIAFAKAGILLL